MRSVISRPRLLAQHVHLVDAVEQPPLEQQLVVERRVERDGDAVLARDRPALAADALDEHLVGLEHVAVDLEAAAVELLELAALQPLAHVAQRRAELRPEHRQVRLDAQLRRLDLAELDLLDAQLVGDLVGVRRARARTRPRRRAGAAAGAASAATPTRACRPSSTTRRTSAISASSVASGSTGSGHGARCTELGPVRHEVPPEVLGEERHHRRDDAQRLHERVPERPERRLVERVEAAARAADVPVRDVVDERLERADHVDGQRRLVRGRRLGDELLRALDEPAVERPQIDRPARGASHDGAKPSMFP